MNDAVDVRPAVAAFGDEPLRRAPAAFEEAAPVGAFQFADEFAVAGAAQFMHRREINARIRVHEEPAVG